MEYKGDIVVQWHAFTYWFLNHTEWERPSLSQISSLLEVILKPSLAFYYLLRMQIYVTEQ